MELSSDPPAFRRPPRELAALLALEERNVGDWQPDELAAVFRHQWAAPLQVGDSPAVCRAPVGPSTEGWSYRLLFTAASPPLEWLILTKEFAKTHYEHPESPLPQPIARMIYFASIFAALLHLGQRITTLSDGALREGVQWGLAQPWIDEECRALYLEAETRLGP